MIFYFSGTGNSRWVAEQFASKTNDVAFNIINQTAKLSMDGKSIGLVFPIHAWGIPEPVIEFIKQLSGKPEFAFAVCTCGGEAGKAMENLSRIFPLDSSYSIVMPNNYVMGSQLEHKEKVEAIIAAAKSKLVRIADQIIAKQPVRDVYAGNLAWIKSNLIHLGFNMAARRTDPFFVTDKCISCGQCARDCPANTITMVEGRPQWGKKCYQCTACINLCPTQAIEYGRGTASRSRYRIDDYI